MMLKMVMMVWRIHCRDNDSNDAKDDNDGVKNSL